MTMVPFAFPFFWMLATSLKELPQVFAYPPVWVPDPIRWGNYPEALTRVQPFGLYFQNTATASRRSPGRKSSSPSRKPTCGAGVADPARLD
jgi:ABC-type glycerol-3-phosphate transport system permease component